MFKTNSILCCGIEFFLGLTSIIYRGYGSHSVYNIKTFENAPIIIGFVEYQLTNGLFLFSEKNPSIKEQLYLYLKRFHTQPSEFFNMDRDLRLEIYQDEYALAKKEYEEGLKAKNIK